MRARYAIYKIMQSVLSLPKAFSYKSTSGECKSKYDYVSLAIFTWKESITSSRGSQALQILNLGDERSKSNSVRSCTMANSF